MSDRSSVTQARKLRIEILFLFQRHGSCGSGHGQKSQDHKSSSSLHDCTPFLRLQAGPEQMRGLREERLTSLGLNEFRPRARAHSHTFE